MLKRLTLVLALVLVAGITCAAYAEVQNVKVSGDIEIIAATRNLELTQASGFNATTGQTTTHPDDFLATITRVMISADLTDNVSTVVRLLNERYWGKESENLNGTGDTNTEINLDLAYVTLKEFLYSPLTMTIGRQELHFGNDMIIGDPDTNNRVTTSSPFGAGARRNMDLTARKSFDAIRSTLNYDPVVIDVVFAKIREGAATNSQDDIDLYGANAAWDVSKKMKVEGYVWQKNLGRKTNNSLVAAPLQPAAFENKRRYTNVIGSRVSGEPVDGFTYSLESAFQFGKYNQNDLSNNAMDRGVLATDLATRPGVIGADNLVDIRAFALEAFLNYDFKKAKYTPSVGACYAYFSGDASDFDGNDAQRRTGWDPMFENQTYGHVANALFNQTNQHVAGLNASMKPFQDVTIKGEYFGYWLAKTATNGFNPVLASRYSVQTVARPGQNIGVTNDGFLGQEIDLTTTYDYTEDVQFSLMGGVFIPGNVFATGGWLNFAPATSPGKSDSAATEVIGSMKVTF
jgi:hypothetical protein